MGQGEDCIPRVCWTQLPSLQIQAVPARGERLTVWPVYSAAFLGGCVCVCLIMLFLTWVHCILMNV